MGVDIVAAQWGWGGPFPLILWAVASALFALVFAHWAARQAPSHPAHWRQVVIGAAAFAVLVATVELLISLWPGREFSALGGLVTGVAGFVAGVGGCWLGLRLALREAPGADQRMMSPTLAVIGFWVGAVAVGVVAGLIGLASFALTTG